MFGRKRKEVPVPKITVLESAQAPPVRTKGKRGATRTEDPPMTSHTLSLEQVSLPEDPVELVTLYRECKPQYQSALSVASQIAATMNAIADVLEAEHEIVLPRVGGVSADPAAARKEQARRLALSMLEEPDAPAPHVNGNGASPFPKARAALAAPQVGPAQQFQPWQNRLQKQQQADPSNPPPVPPGYDPDAWAEEWRQQNTPTPQDILRSSGAYVPPQGKIKGTENSTDYDPVVQEVRAGAEVGGDFGFQQQAIARFSMISAAAVAGAPTIAGIANR